MSFILAADRDHDCEEAFRLYHEYLEISADRFPPQAYALATSDWYFTFGHQAPHDSWLRGFTLEERESDGPDGSPVTSIRIRLLGAHHDGHIEFFYPVVFKYDLEAFDCERGHQDWRYDEFGVSPEGHLIHEIEWMGGSETARWTIEASDVEYTWIPGGKS